MGWKDLLTIAALLVGLLGGMKLLIADPIERRLDRMERRLDGMEERLLERIDDIDRSQQDLQRRVTTIEKNANPQD